MNHLLLLLDPRVLAMLGLAGMATVLFFGPEALEIRMAHAWTVLGLGLLLSLLLWLGGWVLRRRRTGRAATRLEQALEGHLGQAVAAEAPADKEKAQRLRQQLQNAVKTIKGSKLGRHSGRAALYELPWYMIIGHPSAGKSSAIVQSGLSFPLPHGKDAIQGIGGTRNCDWFFTSEGILLDTAGRYVDRKEDRTEWLSFLTLLRKHRPKAPINGILIAASLGEVRAARSAAVIQLAQELRERLQELTEALEVIAPVYVLFTKADLIPGFTAFFAHHDPQERDQVWGATLPYRRDGAADAVEQFERHFSALEEGLKEQALAHMAVHRGETLPPAVLAFPLELAAIRPVLRSFIATLFADNPYQYQPVFRGFYFTSAVQAHESESPVRNGVAELFGLVAPAQAEAVAPATAAEQGFFLKRLFSEVIFADRQLVRQHASPVRQRVRVLCFSGGVVALALALAGWTWSYLGNGQLVGSVLADLEKAQRLQAGRLDLASRLDALELLQDRVEELAAWRAHHPWSVGLGLYQGDTLERKLRHEYWQGVRHVMLEPAAQAIEAYLGDVNRHAAQLRPSRPVAQADALAAAESAATVKAPLPEATAATMPTRYVEASTASVEDAYKALKTYLMLAERQRMEPGHLTDQITRFWRGWLEDNRGSLPRERLMRSAERMISFAMANLQDPAFPVLTSNFALVDQTRDNLRRVVRGTPAIERVYADMKARASTRYAPMTVARIVGEHDKSSLTGSVVVSGAFTREAWQGYVEQAIKEAARSELQSADWVLRTTVQDDLSLQGSPEQIRKALTELYKTEYVREWQRFLQGIAVTDFGSFDAAIEHMNRLGDFAESPLRKLLLMLHEQTAWDNPSLLREQFGQAQEGFVEWVKRSAQRLSPAPMEIKVEARGEGAERSLPMGPVGREFAALHRIMAARDGGASLLDSYLQSLGRLRARFNAMKNQGDPGPAARQLLAVTFDGNGSELSEALKFVEEQMLTGSGDAAKAALKPVLVRPLLQSFAVLIPVTETEVNRLWVAQVLQPFQQTLASKYPFDAASRVEAAPAEIGRVFGPSGAVSRFTTEVLGPLVTRRGDGITPRLWGNLGLHLQPGFVDGLPSWIAALDGPAGAGATSTVTGAAQQHFQLLPMGAPGFVEYTVEIDGRMLRYRNGEATWTTFVWPGNGGTPGARISAITLDGRTLELFNTPGAYGFERLIDAAQVTKRPNGLRELRWGEGHESISLQYRAITSPGPVVAGSARSAGSGLRGLVLPGLVAGDGRRNAVAVAAAQGAAR